MKKNNRPAMFYLMILPFLLMHEVSFSQVKEFTGINIEASYARNGQSIAGHLNKYFKKYSVYKLDIPAVAMYAKNQSLKARFILNLSSDRFNLEIEPNDMRGENFKAVAMTASGSKELAQSFASTYKGFENSDHSNIVRLNITDSTFEGYIRRGAKWLYVDKLSRFMPNERNDKIVVYDSEDVIPDPLKKCGAEILASEKQKFKPMINSRGFALTGNCRFLEIATEADYEYFQAFSADANAALFRIKNILNLVEGLYTSAFNVKFILRYQQIWTTPVDPYSGTTLNEVFSQFQNWWNANRTSISRDETQMFTGRALTTSTVGLAWISAVCNTGWYYSAVANYSPVTNSTIILSAHEFGHNFGADHDESCDGSNIMCSYVQGGIPQWSTQSLNQISHYIYWSGGCMTESFPEDIVYASPEPDIEYLKLIAANTITINSAPRIIMLSTSGFGYIEAGGSIVLTPTNANSLGFLAPFGSTLLARISDVINTCEPLTATNSGVSLKSTSQANHSLRNNTSSFYINPNPFNSVIHLTINAKENSRAHVIIYNSLGVKVKEMREINLLRGNNKISQDGSDLRSGVYMVEINIGNEKKVRKIVKL